MRIIRSFFALFALALLAACDGDGFSPREIVGRWEFSTETNAIYWQRDKIALVLQQDGGFVRHYSVYSDDGRPGDFLRSYARAEGTYRVKSDTLMLEIALVERWTVDAGSDRVQHPAGSLTERYQARLVGNRLLLEEERLVDGWPVTYYHNYRRAAPSADPRDGPGR